MSDQTPFVFKLEALKTKVILLPLIKYLALQHSLSPPPICATILNPHLKLPDSEVSFDLKLKIPIYICADQTIY